MADLSLLASFRRLDDAQGLTTVKPSKRFLFQIPRAPRFSFLFSPPLCSEFVFQIYLVYSCCIHSEGIVGFYAFFFIFPFSILWIQRRKADMSHAKNAILSLFCYILRRGSVRLNPSGLPHRTIVQIACTVGALVARIVRRVRRVVLKLAVAISCVIAD